MATDTSQTPEVRLHEIRQEWGLDVDEATAQAQMEAVKLLGAWLHRGATSASVVVRAVQTLLADPEQNGISKRAAIKEVVQQVSMKWGNAGMKEGGMLGLQGMLLAAWPQDLSAFNFSLVPLFDSAWELTKGRQRQRERLETWRLAHTTSEAPRSFNSVRLERPELKVRAAALELPEPDPDLERISGERHQFQHSSVAVSSLSNVLGRHRTSLISLDKKTNGLLSELNKFLPRFAAEIEAAINNPPGGSQPQQDLLWWGQARYSHGARKPYRRIQDTTERLWWLTWEASELAQDLDVEPAASFLIEVMHQLDEDLDTKRPLKEWLAELLPVLARLHQNEQLSEHIQVGTELDELANKDALGLPVTWARLQAESNRGPDTHFEERARQSIALDLDTPISRGDWAVWLFREALLDRHLQEG